MVTPSAGAATRAIPAPRHWTLSPSDLTFLWNDCHRCFYMKVAMRLGPPRGIFPAVFSRMHSCETQFYSNVRTEAICDDLPPGIVVYGEKCLESRRMRLPGVYGTVSIRGRIDTAVKFDDGTWGVIDFKTSSPKEEYIGNYTRQLHAYAISAEHPVPGAVSFGPVRTLGLLVFDPTEYHQSENTGSFVGSLTWREVLRDDQKFYRFLAQVVTILEQPRPPDPAPGCEHCKYRNMARATGL